MRSLCHPSFAARSILNVPNSLPFRRQTPGSRSRRSIFCAGYRSVVWIAVVLSAASSLSATLLINVKRKT